MPFQGLFKPHAMRAVIDFTPAGSIITGATKKDGVFARLTRRLGIDRELKFIDLEQGYHMHLPDFEYYLYSGGEHARQRLVEQLVELFPHEAAGIRAFFAKLITIYEQMDYATFLGTGPGGDYRAFGAGRGRGLSGRRAGGA